MKSLWLISCGDDFSPELPVLHFCWELSELWCCLENYSMLCRRTQSYEIMWTL